MEIQSDALEPNARVLLIDDLLATGGTLRAAIDLVRQAGASTVESFVLIELDVLNGRRVVEEGQKTVITSLIRVKDS